MAQNQKILKYWFPVFIYSGIIFGVSSIPNLKVPSPQELNLDKLLHCIEYIPFGFFLSQALRFSYPSRSGKFILVLSVLGTCFYGATDEFHQSFVPGRDSDWTEVIADTVGGFIGSIIYLNWLYKK